MSSVEFSLRPSRPCGVLGAVIKISRYFGDISCIDGPQLNDISYRYIGGQRLVNTIKAQN